MEPLCLHAECDILRRLHLITETSHGAKGTHKKTEIHCLACEFLLCNASTDDSLVKNNNGRKEKSEISETRLQKEGGGDRSQATLVIRDTGMANKADDATWERVCSAPDSNTNESKTALLDCRDWRCCCYMTRWIITDVKCRLCLKIKSSPHQSET